MSAGYLRFINDSLVGKKNGASKEQTLYTHQSQDEVSQQESGLPSILSAGMINLIQDLKDFFKARGNNCLENNSATFGDGLYVQAVIEAIRRSNSSRQWRKVEILDEDGGGTVHL